MKTIITATLLACFATVAHAGQQPVYMYPYGPYPTPVYVVPKPNAWQQLGQDMQRFAAQLEYQRQLRRQTEALEALVAVQQRAQWQQTLDEFGRAYGATKAMPVPPSRPSCSAYATFNEAWEAAKSHSCQGVVPSPGFWK